ncbi:dihydrofolate reductase [Candidatus Nanohaloarchaea archaeon]|nr:dihydrofolate reductase [Candidatus Nanohaloarchaea archaeon]
MERIIIAAVAENNVIGKDGEIPWHIPEDLKHFKEKTTGHPVIMGRKTFESLPEDYRPLPSRTNIVLTKSGIDREDIRVAESLEEAYSIAEEIDDKAFIIGGASVYKQALPDADRMVLTEVHREVDGDTYFPEFDEEKWREIEREEHEGFDFVTYSR